MVAVRLWFDKTVETDTPVGVFAKFPELRGAGGTFFMLDQLQKDNLAELWGHDDVQGSVLSADFYNSGAIAPLSDEAIVELEMKLLREAYAGFKDAKVVDSCVKRYQGAVSWFSPGSFSKRPPLQTSVKNVCCAGDWVRMGDREHGAKGLCQERALVSGYEAANELASRGVLNGNRRMKQTLGNSRRRAGLHDGRARVVRDPGGPRSYRVLGLRSVSRLADDGGRAMRQPPSSSLDVRLAGLVGGRLTTSSPSAGFSTMSASPASSAGRLTIRPPPRSAAHGAFLRRLARVSVHEVEPAQGKDGDDEAHHDAEEHQLHLRAALF